MVDQILSVVPMRYARSTVCNQVSGADHEKISLSRFAVP
jgi:hypothetical protein